MLKFWMNTRDYTPKQLARYIGFVFQNPENQLFSLSVDRDIAFGPENLGLKRSETIKRVSKVISLLHLEGLRNRAPYELSGGQQQRVVIGMALFNNPALLIMDEPTTALDVTVEAAVLDLIAELRRDFDTAIMYITHNLGVVARVSTRVGVMYAGEMVERAPVSEIYANPQHPYT